VKSQSRNPKSGLGRDRIEPAPGEVRLSGPVFRLVHWLLMMCLAELDARSFGENARIEASSPPARIATKPVAGKTLVPRLTAQAATSQAEFCAAICDALPRVPMESGVFQDPDSPGKSMRYRLFKPTPLAPTNTYPLTVFLHGGGARRSFGDLLKCASPVFAFGPARLVAPAEQARHPAFVLVPWSGGRDWDDENTRLIVVLLDTLRLELPIDPKRLYVTGQSMGGYGTWRMITRHPDLFAAGVPVCGGGDPAAAPKAKDVSVWAFHGAADGIVPVSETRRIIDALLRAGSKPIYWEYESGTHAGTAKRAYCETGLLDWLFAQTKM